MLDFVKAALPFIITGLCIAIIVVSFNKNEEGKNYMTEGMCIGICLGVSLSSAFKMNMGLGISMGMLIGETVGITLKKK